MKPITARTCILLLILLTLTIRFRSLEARDAMISAFDISAAIKNLARENGLDAQENPTSLIPSAIYFQRPECPAPSVALPFNLNFEASPAILRIAPVPSYKHVFIYLDRSWAEQNRVGIFAEWLKYCVYRKPYLR